MCRRGMLVGSPNSDQFVQLIHRTSRFLANGGNIFGKDKFQPSSGQDALCLETGIHGRNNLIIKEVLNQQRVLECGSPVIVLVEYIHLELLPGVLRKFETPLLTTQIKHAEEFIRFEILQIDGLRQAFLQLRIGRKQILHAFRFSGQHKHPVLVSAGIVQCVHQRPDNASFGIITGFVRTKELVGPVNHQRSAASLDDYLARLQHDGCSRRDDADH